MEVAAHERDLDDLVPDPDEELAVAVQDQQAADGLPPALREQLNLVQQTAAHRLVHRGQHLLYRAII